jgi:hypothetical protein
VKSPLPFLQAAKTAMNKMTDQYFMKLIYEANFNKSR